MGYLIKTLGGDAKGLMNMLGNRWKKAQKAETKAWQANPLPQGLTDSERRENLARICEYTSLSEEELKHMRILDIGGPLTERAFDSASISPKLVLDPLLPFVRLVGRQDKSCHRVRGVGEYLPLPDNSIDLCWCANTIDHTSSPSAVLREIGRVLDNRGMLVISCHTFPPWTGPLFPLFSIMDKPHPHHFTLRGIKTLLEHEFHIQDEAEVKGAFQITSAQKLKDRVAAMFGVRYFYFRCTPIE